MLLPLAQCFLRFFAFSDIENHAKDRLIAHPAAFAIEPAQSIFRMVVAILKIHAAGGLHFGHALLHVVPIVRMYARSPDVKAIWILGIDAKNAVQFGREPT